MPTKTNRTPPRLKGSIKEDAIAAFDILNYDFRFACEDCSHFDSEQSSCTMGYNPAPHRRERQKYTYELKGKMALCRFLEID